MQLKDYYAILALHPSATTDEIKKAYRRLAHLYHPDKTSDDDYAAMKFADIKEAYEVLTHPAKKDYYLQQRWYLKSVGKKLKTETQTPVGIFKEMLALEQYVSRLDTHRMDHEGILNQVTFLLSGENINLLNIAADKKINAEIVSRAISIGEALPYRHAETLARHISDINAIEGAVVEKTNAMLQRKRRSEKWDKQKPWVMLLIVLVICLVIYFFSN